MLLCIQKQCGTSTTSHDESNKGYMVHTNVDELHLDLNLSIMHISIATAIPLGTGNRREIKRRLMYVEIIENIFIHISI